MLRQHFPAPMSRQAAALGLQTTGATMPFACLNDARVSRFCRSCADAADAVVVLFAVQAFALTVVSAMFNVD